MREMYCRKYAHKGIFKGERTFAAGFAYVRNVCLT